MRIELSVLPRISGPNNNSKWWKYFENLKCHVNILFCGVKITVHFLQCWCWNSFEEQFRSGNLILKGPWGTCFEVAFLLKLFVNFVGEEEDSGCWWKLGLLSVFLRIAILLPYSRYCVGHWGCMSSEGGKKKRWVALDLADGWWGWNSCIIN